VLEKAEDNALPRVPVKVEVPDVARDVEAAPGVVPGKAQTRFPDVVPDREGEVKNNI
jgi:hypothetical protein